ncbi:MAG TPA: hypothetical protein VI583_08780, partial [Cyclobacteriaceae bacterium]|nr:hypothetical protein [Cyclobacteriaceae bacterium]
HAARGEYVSFQLVIRKKTDSALKGIMVDMPLFGNSESKFNIAPELFLEWAVEVKTPSTGYPRASLGAGWYPDALIPIEYIQMDSARVTHRWTYPLEIPDFNNRIDNQLVQILWVDQYIPYSRDHAPPGKYLTTLAVSIGGLQQEIPISLNVWDFDIPSENNLRASLQHEGFLSYADEDLELETYQLFKRNRISLMDPTYKPELKIEEDNHLSINWTSFDTRLGKYFSGEAFTHKYGYANGPGYGEPIEVFILPFNVFGKHGDPGWPDTGRPEVERESQNINLYRKVIGEVRDHLNGMIDPGKTELTVYLNGLDESYFPEAWARMVFYGNIFKEDYPEARFRIDGGYSEEAMTVVKNSIGSWASHTINYDFERIRKYQEMGIEVWIYGPMIYESKVNSWVGSSTFIDLPLVNDRAISWSCWKYGTHSWISWGIGAGWERAWYDPESWKDSYKTGSDSDAGFSYKKLNGNGLLLYSPGIIPNVYGVCPSIRLKTMRNGVQEYEYMRKLSELDGSKDRINAIVNEIIKDPFGEASIGNLDVWSYDAEQWDLARIRIGELIHNAAPDK